jgi:hypothetical protein
MKGGGKMASTYSSWEYSQGPTLYIDSSGFREIDDDKNFIYFYIVTYSPVEYKRKVTNESGVSTYEYKYSFGTDASSRKTLGEFTFTGKKQMTKTVSHEVTESGFKDSITKTFYIDTNINTNIQNNSQITVDPTYKVDTHSWTLNKGSSVTAPNIGKNYIGWFTVTKTGYRTETYYTYETRWEYGIVDWEWYGWLVDAGEDYTQYPIYNWYKVTYWVPHTEYVSYTYSELYNSYCKLSLNSIREKIRDYSGFSSVTIAMKTKDYMNKAPNVYIDTSVTATNKRIQLQPKNSGGASADSYLEYYLPMNIITDSYKNIDDAFLIIDKGSCSAKNGYIIDAYAFIEIEAAKIPYINLVVEAYSNSSKSWSQCCVIPYMSHKEIELMRDNKQHISKNLFFPSNLPPTDSNYRIKLDTNLVAKDTEMLTNFRLDVLSDQLIPPGSIDDKKIYVNNDSIERENEVEIDEVDSLKLNILGSTKHAAKTYAGFLKKGANDISAYLRTSVIEIDKTIPEANRDKNIWFSYIDHINGGWASNNLFIANTFDFPQPHILQANDPNLVDEIIRFRILYKNLKPRSTYRLLFKANAQAGFVINNINTINSSDELNLTTSKIYSEGTYDSNKVKVTNCDYTFYTPPYKRMYSGYNDLISEHNTCGRDIQLEIEIQTKDINNSDNNEMIISIKRRALKNITIKGLQCICIDSTGTKYLDVTEPYHENVNTGRLNETHMTIYYDGIQIEQINPLLFNDMIYLRSELNKIRAEYALEPYAWSSWTNTEEIDEEGHFLGVEKNQPLRAVHFNEVKQCCLKTYEDLLALKPPVIMNTTPTLFRDNTGLIPLQEGDETSGYVLQHVLDKEGQPLDIDKYFPEWRKLIDLINRN